jgi:hypothetical protein
MTKKLVASIKSEFDVEIINIGFDCKMTLEPDETKHEDDPTYLVPDVQHFENTIKWVELVIGGVGLMQPESYWNQKKVLTELESVVEEQVSELFNKI